ncbi:MAG: hypothetical protein MI974_02190 [Chitinophagales bacterium]|nr:hypothetical protein [Chitinophagales bacterium]
MNGNNIKVKFKIIDSTIVGYGSLYQCKITEVSDDNLKADSIKMTILSKDIKIRQFIEDNNGRIFIGTFAKNKDHEPYAIMPITGFVDHNKTSWLLTDLDTIN